MQNSAHLHASAATSSTNAPDMSQYPAYAQTLHVDKDDLCVEFTSEKTGARRTSLGQAPKHASQVSVQTQHQFRKVKADQAHQFGVQMEAPEECLRAKRSRQPTKGEEPSVLVQTAALRAMTLDWQANELELENKEDAELFELAVTSERVQSSITVFFFIFNAISFSCGLLMIGILFYSPTESSRYDYLSRVISLEPLLSRVTLSCSEVALITTAVRLQKVREHLWSFGRAPRSTTYQTHRMTIQRQLTVDSVAMCVYILCVICCLVTMTEDWDLSLADKCSVRSLTVFGPQSKDTSLGAYKGLVVTKGLCLLIGALATLYSLQINMTNFRFIRFPGKVASARVDLLT